ncbi:MAG: 50S ribosomal protein L11 methyltransferase [Ignavibacteriaceae bacterium]
MKSAELLPNTNRINNYMVYKEFLITSEPFNPEILSGLLWNLDISGISEEVNCLKVFSVSITKFDIENILNDLVHNKLVRSFHVEENFVEERNWNEEWENSREIIRVSEKFVIKPTFKNYSAGRDEIVLTIDPKMSFGTGEHQTTRLMLQLEEKYVKKGTKVLDIGTGTGVLAIAAIKLGASSAIANDIDEWCYNNCKENSELNDTVSDIDFRICTLEEITETDFDLVVANIQKDILLNLAGEIYSRLNKNGYLLISGLLYLDEQEINTYYSMTGFIFLETTRLDEWIAMAFKKVEQ